MSNMTPDEVLAVLGKACVTVRMYSFPQYADDVERARAAVAAMIARVEELEKILGSLSAEADACVSLLRPEYDGHANFLAANVAKAIAILEKK